MSNEAVEKEKKRYLPVWARIILILIAYLFSASIFQVIGLKIIEALSGSRSSAENLNFGEQITLHLFGFFALLVVVYIFRKFIDKASIKSLGFSSKKRMIDFWGGLVSAVLIIGMGSLLLFSLGYISFSSIQFQPETLLLNFILFIIVSLNEEILFRGYILNNLMDITNKYFALIISSALFMLLHSFNDNLSTIGVINLFLAGMLLGSGYIFTKNLWFPLSLHLFWNFFQGPIFGYAVSGQKFDSLLSLEKVSNKQIITGGKFGFEGSILCTILIIIFIALTMHYYNKKTT